MNDKKRAKGLHEYRFKQNPHEEIAARLWANEGVLPDLLGDGTIRGRVYPTDHEREVAATLMQWLGSPVGRSFLDGLIKAFAEEDRRQRRT